MKIVKETPRWLNAANLLTLARLAAVPFAVGAILTRHHERALAIVLAAGLTDVVDERAGPALWHGHTSRSLPRPGRRQALSERGLRCLAVISSVPWWLVGKFSPAIS